MSDEQGVTPEIKVGDTVWLLTGGVPMTVERVYRATDGNLMVEATYFDGEKDHRGQFLASDLEVRPRYGDED